MVALHFQPPTRALESLVTQPNEKPPGKGILWNIVHPTQVDSLQGFHTVYKGDQVRIEQASFEKNWLVNLDQCF